MYMTLLVARRQRHRALSLSCFALLVVMAVCLAQRAGLVTVCPASLAMMESAHHDDTTDTSDTDNCQLTGELLRSVDVIELPILLPLCIATLLIILLQRKVWPVLSSPFPPVIRRHLLFCTFRE